MNRHVKILSFAVSGAAAVSAVPSIEHPKGYLAPGEFDVTHIVEPAPRPCDPRYETDRKIFKATRSLVGASRWALATSDAD